MCLGERQLHTKCFLAEQPGSDCLGLDWLDELGLLKWVSNTIAEEQMPTSVPNLTEIAEKENTLGRNRQIDLPETVTRIEAKTKAGSGPINTKRSIIKGFRPSFRTASVHENESKAISETKCRARLPPEAASSIFSLTMCRGRIISS